MRWASALLLSWMVSLGIPVSIAQAGPIFPGTDYYVVVPGPNSTYDFDATPIPSDFFKLGSDPLAGTVPLVGFALPNFPSGPFFSVFDNVVNRNPNGLPAITDTVVRRPNPTIDLDPIPQADIIPVEIQALSLASSQPIIVTENGGQNPEPWLIAVGLSIGPPQQGLLQILKDLQNGGEFQVQLPISPRLAFAREQDVQDAADGLIDPDDVEVRIFDFDDQGLPPLQFETLGTPPWSTEPPPGHFVPHPPGTDLFFPGVKSPPEPFTIGVFGTGHSLELLLVWPPITPEPSTFILWAILIVGATAWWYCRRRAALA